MTPEFSSGPDYQDHPVVGVTWHDAQAFCQSRGMRLPTEAEWEYAAKGGLQGENFPWGDGIDPEKANYHPSDGAVTVETRDFAGRPRRFAAPRLPVATPLRRIEVSVVGASTPAPAGAPLAVPSPEPL